MFRSLLSIIVLSLLLTCFSVFTQAHMQMSSPYPLRSPLDAAAAIKDYDMTSPLFADGSNFACKHYQNDDSSYEIKATYVAGATYSMSVAGTANHNGGSCQLSLSYDNGATFKVIKSIVGGCPLANSYAFTIPSSAPSSTTALLSWSWFNIVGNREMYQNCARVKIVAGPNQRLFRRGDSKRQSTPLQNFPDMFVCNVGNGCHTIERREVVFPNPGSDISYGQNLITPDPGPGFQIDGGASPTIASTPAGPSTTAAPFSLDSSSSTTDTVTGTGSLETGRTLLTLTSSTSTVSDGAFFTSTPPISPAAASTSSTNLAAGNTLTTLTPSAPASTLPSTGTASTQATTSATPSSIAVPVPCTPGAFACNSISTFSQCVATSATSTTFIYMGSVAAGMQCINGQFSRQNDGPCTPSGSIFCNGLQAFYMCDQGGLVSMGPVAAGTECRNGEIVVAQR